jgi:hypothetical protein
MVYAAMDVHRKRSQLAIVEDDGRQLLNRRVANRREGVMPLLRRLDPGTPVAFEAAYGWGWLVELLEELELEPLLAHPLRCKAIASARLKNDKVDAATLAHLLRSNLLAEALIAPKDMRDLRALLRCRPAWWRSRPPSKPHLFGARRLWDPSRARDAVDQDRARVARRARIPASNAFSSTACARWLLARCSGWMS